jgi:uncharacterized membrane protein
MNTAVLVGNEPRPSSSWAWGLLLLGAALAAGHAVLVVTVDGYGDAVSKQRMFATPAVGYAHMLGGALASLIGPFQFLPSMRRRYPRAHVWVGRAYLTCVAGGALAGLYLSPGSYAANTFGIAFILLALAWLYTGAKAWLAIRARDVQTHRRWMIRNYALTYSAVTLRIQMPLLMLAGMSPVLALNVVGWTCWVPTLIGVEWWMRRRSRLREHLPRAFDRL